MYLPQELIQQIVEEVAFINGDLVADSIYFRVRRTHLKNLSLVSKDWYHAARRSIWRKIDATDAGDVKVLIQFLKIIPELGNLVKVVNLTGRGYTKVSSEGDSQFFGEEEFNTLIQLLPNITSLGLDSLLFNSFKFITSPAFPHLNHLTFSTPSKQLASTFNIEDLELLQQILLHSPNLNSLELQLGLDDLEKPYRQLSQCPPLESFNLHGSSYSTCYYLSSIFHIIPLSSLSKLKEFTLNHNGSSSVLNNKVIEFVPTINSTLKSLCIRTFSMDHAYSYQKFVSIFPKLNVLETLDIQFDQVEPDNFLQHIPSSTRTIKTEITQDHCQHLQLYPRSSLNLKSLKVDSIGLLDFLPKSVETVLIQNILLPELDAVLSSLKVSVNFGLSNLIIAYLDIDSDTEEEDILHADEIKKEFIHEFNLIGVKLMIEDGEYERLL